VPEKEPVVESVETANRFESYFESRPVARKLFLSSSFTLMLTVGVTQVGKGLMDYFVDEKSSAVTSGLADNLKPTLTQQGDQLTNAVVTESVDPFIQRTDDKINSIVGDWTTLKEYLAANGVVDIDEIQAEQARAEQEAASPPPTGP